MQGGGIIESTAGRGHLLLDHNEQTLINAQGLTGEGLDTGTVYRVSGPGHFTFNDDDLVPPVRERTFYDLVHVVGPGDAAKLLVRVGFHLTFNRDGELVAVTEVESVNCQ